MKIISTKRITDKQGNTTKITIEQELDYSDKYQISEYLETIGYFQRTIPQKIMRFLSGK